MTLNVRSVFVAAGLWLRDLILLIASGTVPPGIFLPLVFLAISAGAFLGYSWVRGLEPRGLSALAEKLHASRSLDRVAKRLRAAGPLEIAASRLIPGMRVYTTLIAEAIGVRRRDFLLGVIPATALWVGAFTFLGALVGVPAERLFGTVDRLALRGAVLVALGVGVFLAIRLIPSAESRISIPYPASWRIPVAVAADVGVVGSIAAGLSAGTRFILHFGDPDGYVDAVAVLATVAFSYIVIARRSVGPTAGEALLGVTYRLPAQSSNGYPLGRL